MFEEDECGCGCEHEAQGQDECKRTSPRVTIPEPEITNKKIIQMLH